VLRDFTKGMVLIGNSGANSMVATNFIDTILGGGGNDTILGGAATTCWKAATATTRSTAGLGTISIASPRWRTWVPATASTTPAAASTYALRLADRTATASRSPH